MKKTILVIGGTSGYGKGIVEALSKEHNVVIAGRSSQTPMDVRSTKSVGDFFGIMRGFGYKFDTVIYCAGLAIGKDLVKDKSIDDSEKIMQTNTLGLLRVAKTVFEELKEANGMFIHLGSIASRLNYIGGADYCGSKAASSTIMRTLRNEWLGSGIRTCSIEIGIGNTEFHKNRYNGDMVKADKHANGIRQIEPIDLGNFVKTIIDLPDYLNLDEIVLKPIDQATHGVTVNDIKNQF
tara:strand:- start:7696 stop:8406 length:711 start_codon:yes stop_codon:yes gene_type:complete